MKINTDNSIFIEDDIQSTTPKMPVRLSSCISSSSLTVLPSSVSISKERSLSCSLSQPLIEVFPTSSKCTSLHLAENDEVNKST
jgi:hypothetical protein